MHTAHTAQRNRTTPTSVNGGAFALLAGVFILHDRLVMHLFAFVAHAGGAWWPQMPRRKGFISIVCGTTLWRGGASRVAAALWLAGGARPKAKS